MTHTPQSLRLAAASLATTPLDWEGNRARIVGAIHEAQSLGAEVLCLPELCISGYGCEDMFLAPQTPEMAMDILEKIVPETSGIFVCLGLPILFRGGLFNVVASVKDGELVAFHAKANLAGDGVHYEQRWFKPWPQGDRSEHLGIPVGDIVVNAAGVRIGYEICEDAWVADRPGGRLSKLGVELMLNPSASHFAFGKADVRRRFVMEGSRAFCCAYIYSNLHGNESGRTVYDGGAMIASCGEMLSRGTRFPSTDYSLCFADVNLNVIKSRAASTSSRSVSTSESKCEVRCRGFAKASAPRRRPIARSSPAAWEKSTWEKEEEFTRALAVALWDYSEKSGTSGFVVSLSGGADSSAVCCLIFYMLCLRYGRSAARGKMKTVLSTVYQSTPQSSTRTGEAARVLAEALGARHTHVELDMALEFYGRLYAQVKGRNLSWEDDAVAIENLQARLRAPFVWLLANTENKLLLATSNRSEAAVGYATMDGDTCGSLSPLAGIDKTFLLRWLEWAKSVGPEGLGPIPELSLVLAHPPTAELRPAEENQTDEKDLMPYGILGELENLLVRDKLSPQEAMEALGSSHPDTPRETLSMWLSKFLRLWHRNQWKRERYAPSFHVDDRNLDPRSWCRYPLLSRAQSWEP